MRFFKSFGDSLNYKEILPLDGAFSRAHALYSGSPIFFGSDGETLVQDARKLALPPDVEGSSAVEYLHMFDGTESGYDRASRRIIWKAYWLEYIHAFDQLISVLSDSIVTVYVGRQAIELGFKYLLLENRADRKDTRSRKISACANFGGGNRRQLYAVGRCILRKILFVYRRL